MKGFLQWALLVLVLLAASGACAAEPFREITAVELRGMLQGDEPAPVVIDTRSPAEYGEAHIGSALNITLGDLKNNPGLLNYPTDRAIVFYCNGFS